MTKAAISFLIIPVLGFLASFYWLGLDVAENISARNICLMSDFEVRSTFSNPNEVKSYCNNHVGPLLILQKSSIISFLISFGVLILFKATSSYCGTDRDRNANLFPNTHYSFNNWRSSPCPRIDSSISFIQTNWR